MNKLDKIVDTIDESNYELDNEMKNNILKKIKRKQKQKSVLTIIKSIAAIVVLSFLTFTFIPNNPVNAFMKQVFSFIPGVGVTALNEEYKVERVLNNIITYEDEKNYVDLYQAYIIGDYIQLAVQTDLYTIEKDKDDDFIDFINNTFLIIDGEKIKATGTAGGSEIFESSYPLSDAQKNAEEFTLFLERENIMITFTLEKVKSSENPSEVGSCVEVDDLMIFANLKREKNSCEVIISQVAPSNYKSISYEWFEHEDQLFTQGVYIIDSENNKYELVEKDINKNRYKNTFYFNVPAKANGLRIVIPQLLYEIQLDEKVLLQIPKEDEKQMVNYVFDMKTHSIELESVIYRKNEYDNDIPAKLVMKMSEITKDEDYIIRRVLPLFETKKHILSQFMKTSQGTYSEVWKNHEGLSISEYEGMKEKDQVKISFEVEMAYIKDVIINLD